MSDTPATSRLTARRVRLIARWVSLAASALLVWRLTPWRRGALIVPALSPFVAIVSLIALRAAGWIVALGVPVLVLALLRRQWFCRYACPLGLLQDLVPRRSGRPRWKRWPQVGQWLALLTLGGACAGYPLFLWLDPLAIFAGFAAAWHRPITLAAALAASLLPIVLVLSVVAPRLWCARLCPLGGLQELLWIRWRARREPVAPAAGAGWPLGRRTVLGIALGAAVAMLRRARSRAVVRPPGATGERQFAGVCVRCGNCARSCPHGIIQPDLGSAGVTAALCPKLEFTNDYCREDCAACGQVCPSGALRSISLEEKRRWVIGVAEVDLDTCRLAAGKECDACIVHCPYDAVAIHSSEDGFSTVPLVDADRCTGCGACEHACPVRPARSIRVHG